MKRILVVFYEAVILSIFIFAITDVLGLYEKNSSCFFMK